MRAGTGTSSRTARRLAFVGLTLLVAIAFSIDLAITRAAVPETSAPVCAEADDFECQAEREAASSAQRERAEELETAIDERSWIYLIVLAGGMIGLAAHLARPGEDPGDAAADLGVAGVLLFVLAFVISKQTQMDTDLVRIPPPGRLVFVGLALMAAATAGAIISRWRPEPVPPPSLPPPPPGSTPVPSGTIPPPPPAAEPEPESTWPRTFTWLALGLAAATALLAAAQLGLMAVLDHVNVCEEDVPAWRQAVMVTASITAACSLACAAVVLLARRWFVSIVCVVVSPFALLVALLSNACIL